MTLKARVLISISSLLLASASASWVLAEEKTGDNVKFKDYCVDGWNECIRICQNEGFSADGLKTCLTDCNDVWLGEDCQESAANIRNPGRVVPKTGGVLEPLSEPTLTPRVVPKAPLSGATVGQ